MAPRTGTHHVQKVLNDINDNKDNSSIIKILNDALDRYNDAIGYIEVNKKLKKGSLLLLDQYVQGLDADTIEITKENLITIFNWKITRGKFRPLMKHIDSNSDDDVKKISREAFNKIRQKDWKAGMYRLTNTV